MLKKERKREKGGGKEKKNLSEYLKERHGISLR